MSQVEIKLDSATAVQIVDHLEVCDKAFFHSLSQRVDVKKYAEKIIANAKRFEAWVDGELGGLVAIYCNETDQRSAFITNVSVSSVLNGRGIGSGLLRRCINHTGASGFECISLEVEGSNKAAISLYEKFGFTTQSEQEGRVKMSLLVMEMKEKI